MADIKIPFQYCRIERAARFLDCDVEDLLTLGLENKISLNLMLDGVKASLLVTGDIDNAELWLKKLKLSNKFTYYPTVAITDYSYFSFNETQIDKSGDRIHIPKFYSLEMVYNNCSISCTGRTYGLWRLNQYIDEILNYKMAFIDGSELSPCYPDKYNIVNQLLIDERDNHSKYYRLTDKDLWITATDIRRMLDCKGDYYLLDSLNEIKVLSKTKEQLNHIPSPHPTTERHAINREKIFMAAMRFREEQPHVFAESCRKADGSINYSAFARELIERPSFFPQSTLPMKTVEAIAKVISTAYKSPNQR